jgi:hypothetical protein
MYPAVSLPCLSVSSASRHHQEERRSMPNRDPDRPDWDIPLGMAELGAMAVVGGVAYTLGGFSFYGIEFLPYWPRMGGWTIGLSVLAAAFGTFAEWLIWTGRAARAFPFSAMWRTGPGAMAAAGILVALAIGWWSAHPQYQCAVLGLPLLGLLAFAGVVMLQDSIVTTLRKAGRTTAAVAALLALEAGMMFMIGEWLAIGHFQKGLAHFQTEGQAERPISTFGAVDFRVDYARREIVLRTRAGAGDPVEIRRPLAAFACN